jgi:hypothetical protein
MPPARASTLSRVLPAASLAALALLAAWPVLRAGYPTIGDGLNHFYRLVEFEHLLGQGVWFPRWATDLGYGYGYPLFNFTPPLSYYLGALFGGLGLNTAHSLLAVYALAWLLAVSGAYRLARQQGGPAAGLLAAAAYGLAPYLYFNALARGALPETLGLGLLPWVLWAFYRLAARPSRAGLLLAALLYAALILIHLLTGLLALPLILLFWWLARLAAPAQAPAAPSRASRLLITNYQLLLALLLGVGLAGYFILPALLETGSVHIGQLTGPGDLDYHNNFLSLGTLFAWPATFDSRLVSRAVPPSLSLAALALALLGLARRVWPVRRLSAWDAGLWLGAIELSLFSLRLSLPLWEHLPGAGTIQFPWRLVGPASLLLALLAARALDVPTRATAGTRPPATISAAAPAVALAALFFYSLTWTFSASPPAPATASVRDLAGYELSSGELGTTSTGEFLPMAVSRLPDPHSLEGAYALHSVIQRLGPLPAGVSVSSQSATVTSAQAVVTAQSAAALGFDFFDFPGWRATLDGQPAAISASQPFGLITVQVPAGQHSLQVTFGSTPLRASAMALSFIAAGLLLVFASGRISLQTVGVLKTSTVLGNAHQTAGVSETPTVSRLFPIALVMTVLLLAIRGLAIDGHATIFAHSRFDGARVTGVGQTLDVNFEDQLVLIGADLPRGSVAAGSSVPVTLYWRAQNTPAHDYSTTLQVLDAGGRLIAQVDTQNPGGLPTSRWGPGLYAVDRHLLALPAGLAPGQYALIAGVYQYGGAALSFLDFAGAPQGQLAPLGSLTVGPAR